MAMRPMGRAAALAALVLVFVLVWAAPALAGMRLEAPSEVPRGDAFFVRLVSDEPMDSVHIAWGSMELDAAPRVVDGGGWEVLAALGTGSLARPGTGHVRVVVRSGGEERTLAQDVKIRDRAFEEEHLKVAYRMVHLTEEQLARHKREKVRVLKVLRHVSPERYWNESFTRPVPGGVSSTYGLRRFFNGEARRPHAGVDLRGGKGTPVKATAPGVVAFADDTYFGGNTVLVDHGLGVVSMYGHLSAFAVQEGAFVSAGQKLGEIGSTGRVTGPHLHFGLAVLGQFVDPLPLLGGAFGPQENDMARKKDDFETRLARLKEIVVKLETGDLPLEDGVALFKEGVKLAKSCRTQLDKARNEVKLLVDGALTEFGAEEDDG